MRSVATPAWSPRAPAAQWSARPWRVGGRGGPQLKRELWCDTVHQSVRWQMWGSTGEAGQRGWRRTHRQRGCSGGGRGPRGSTVIKEVSMARGEGRAVYLWLKRDGR
jgi:hypothetical protein